MAERDGDKLDDIRTELARISDELGEDSNGTDLGRRMDLKERQSELRTLARETADVADLDGLRQRADDLERRIDRIAKRNVSGASIGGGGGTGGGGIDPYEASQLNAAIREGGGLEELKRELDQVRARIERAETAG